MHAEASQYEKYSNLRSILKSIIDRADSKDLIDLQYSEPELVIDLLSVLVGTDAYILHGSNSKIPYSELKPKLANDLNRASGNQLAVYASVDWVEVLFHALLNKQLLDSQLNSYVIGYLRDSNDHKLRLSRNLFSYWLENPSKIWSSGFVYILHKEKFIPSANSRTEYYSKSPIQPLAVIRVGTNICNLLFGSTSNKNSTCRIECYTERIANTPS